MTMQHYDKEALSFSPQSAGSPTLIYYCTFVILLSIMHLLGVV